MWQRARKDDLALRRRTPSWWALALLLAWCAAPVAGCGSTIAPLTAAATPLSTPYGNGATPTLGMQRTATPAPTETPVGPTWIPLRSQSAADVLAAVKQAPFLALVSSAPPNSDGYTDVSHLGTPVLVLAYHAPGDTSTSAHDYYEVPVLTTTGAIDNMVNAQLNADHTAVYVGSISGYSAPMDQWPATLVSADQAEQVVLAAFRVGLASGRTPKLIYLAAYDTMDIETGKLSWNAGGGGPMNPIWLVPGADAHDYFVGTDGRAYTLAQLPLR